MANKIKVERLQSLITRDLTIIMQREIRDETLNMLSVHTVKLSNDLSHAKVYYSSLLKKPEAELESVIQKYKNEIRSKLAHKLAIYRCPNLEFIIDHSLDNANNIEAILQKLK